MPDADHRFRSDPMEIPTYAPLVASERVVCSAVWEEREFSQIFHLRECLNVLLVCRVHKRQPQQQGTLHFFW